MSTDVEPLTCQEFVEILTDYLEGVVDADERAEIEHHIAICGGCSNYALQTRVTIELLGRIAGQDGADVRTDELVGMFREWRATRS